MLDDAASMKLLGAAMGDPACLDPSTEGVRDLISDLECRALVLRFGVEDGQLRTLGEVARELDIDREEAGRLTNGALSKLQALAKEHMPPPPAGAVGSLDFSLDLYPGATDASEGVARSLHRELRTTAYRVQSHLVLREGDLYVEETCILRTRFEPDGSMVLELRTHAPSVDGMEPASPGWFALRIAPGKVLGWGWADAIGSAAVEAGATPMTLFSGPG